MSLMWTGYLFTMMMTTTTTTDDDDRRRHPLQVTSKMIDNAMVVLHIAEAVVMGRMIEENSITVKSHFELIYTTLFSVVGPTL